jgi:hypothetical protein
MIVDIVVFFAMTSYDIVACCLKAGISEAEQTSIASQRFDNTHIRSKE